YIGNHGFSLLCAVVSARHQKEGKELREHLPHTFFLVPGYGAQGGNVDDLLGMRNKEGLGIIVNSSRGITYAYKNKKYNEKDYAAAAREAVLEMKKELK
ncbi:MAG: orotidine 5'-phosphate decarboxylase, partial [Defluviitaleaceae bacterium]|nr:orotidine 5'-phosphate decarboxylase [Defluviitaleaceae bacterium]